MSETRKSTSMLSDKYSLTIVQMMEYTGIGERKLRQIIGDNPSADYLLYCGVKVLFKRKKFEDYLDATSGI